VPARRRRTPNSIPRAIFVRGATARRPTRPRIGSTHERSPRPLRRRARRADLPACRARTAIASASPRYFEIERLQLAIARVTRARNRAHGSAVEELAGRRSDCARAWIGSLSGSELLRRTIRPRDEPRKGGSCSPRTGTARDLRFAGARQSGMRSPCPVCNGSCANVAHRACLGVLSAVVIGVNAV